MLAELVTKLLDEHKSLNSGLNTLSNLIISSQPDLKKAAGILFHLKEELTDHIIIEDSELFPRIMENAAAHPIWRFTQAWNYTPFLANVR